MQTNEAMLKAIEKYQEDVKKYTDLVAKYPNNKDNWNGLGNACMGLGKVDEAINSFTKMIELDPKDVQTMGTITLLYQGKGDRVQARKYADMAFSVNPKHFRPNSVLAGLMIDEGQLEKARDYYSVCLQSYPHDPLTNLRLGDVYMSLGNKDKAIETWTNGTKTVYNTPISHCSRGQCYYKIGKKEEAMKDFKVAESTMHDATGFTPSQIEFAQKALQAILGAEAVSAQAEAELKHLNTQTGSNSALKKFTVKVQELQAKKKEFQDKVVHELSKTDQEASNNVSELEKLKEEFNKQLAEMKQAMVKMDNRITNVEHGLDHVKEELDNKLDDFKKKLTKELEKQDLPAEDRAKLQAYFKAFLETFSSGYVTAQVVASGQVQLDAGSNAAAILSTIASFAPFVGSVLESGIKTVGEFLKSKEMITSARKLKSLAGDTSELSQLVGKVGYEIVLNKDQQHRILRNTEKELEEVSGNLFQKIMKFCDNLNETVDSYLYGKLYGLPVERLGHNDANLLIEKWIKGEVFPAEIEKQFIQIILTPTNERNTVNKPVPEKVQGRGACCNMF